MNLSSILTNQTVCSLNNQLSRTIVLLQLKQLSALILLLEIQDIVDVGTTETIDTLCVVTNHAHLTRLLCQLKQNSLLCIVGILILIHQHILIALHIFLTNILVMLEQQVGLYQQIIKVHRISLATTLYVPIIYMCHLWTFFLYIVGSPRALHILLRHQQMVLRHRDTVSHRCRLIGLIV